MAVKDQLKFSLAISPALNDIINEIADKTHASISDVLLRSIMLMKVAVKEMEQGNYIGIIDKNKEIKMRITGLSDARHEVV